MRNSIWRLTENRAFIVIVLLVLSVLYFSPYIVKGKDSHLVVHDNLDSLSNRGIFNGKYVGRVIAGGEGDHFCMPGVDKIFWVNEIFLDKFLTWALGYWHGYVVNEVVYRVLAFIGLFLLLLRFTPGERFPEFLAALVAFAFATLPHYSAFNFSVAGVPMMILLFHNLYREKHITLTLVSLFLLTFYWGLVHSGFFVLLLLGLAVIYLWRKRSLNKYFIAGIAVLLAGWLITHHSLFIIKFFHNIPTTRAEMKPTDFYGYSLWGALKNGLYMFLHANFHARSNHLYLLLPSVLLLGGWLAWTKRFERRYLHLALLLLVYTIFAAFSNGLYTYRPVLSFYERTGFGFNLGRFFVLSPGVWYLLWGVVLLSFYRALAKMNLKKTAFIIIFALAAVQVGINGWSYTGPAYREKPTFNEFISWDLFQDIKGRLDLGEDERVGCIGFFPSVANYNGFKTVGAYKNIYPLTFKHRFYEVIKPELDRDKNLEKYFLSWGSRAYLFDNRIGTRYGNQRFIKKRIPHIACDLNVEALKTFGVTHLFSTSRIANAAEKKLTLILVRDAPRFYYRIYVYRLD